MTSDEPRRGSSWLEAGALLDEQRKRELIALTPERAAFLAEALFSLPWPAEVIARRRGHSGLLEMQDLFRALHPR